MKEAAKDKMIAVVGPTASGKTALAVKLAKYYDGEIISADSMQIYRGMDIATAKPDREEREGIPHHLMDFLDPGESFSVSDFTAMAHRCTREILSRGKLPVLCGGTGLYVRSFLENVQFLEEPEDPQLRQQLNERCRTEGGEALLEELRSFDPETAAKLHPGNGKRIIRAIEIYRLTGKTMSYAVAQSKREPFPYEYTMIGLTYADRQQLYDRIDRRVDRMLSQGLVEEAKRFYASPAGPTAAAAIGYKELLPYLEGRATLEEAAAHLKQETRHYAKRQLTWFRKDSDIHWIRMDCCEDPFAEAKRIIADTLGIG